MSPDLTNEADSMSMEEPSICKPATAPHTPSEVRGASQCVQMTKGASKIYDGPAPYSQSTKRYHTQALHWLRPSSQSTKGQAAHWAKRHWATTRDASHRGKQATGQNATGPRQPTKRHLTENSQRPCPQSRPTKGQASPARQNATGSDMRGPQTVHVRKCAAAPPRNPVYERHPPENLRWLRPGWVLLPEDRQGDAKDCPITRTRSFVCEYYANENT